MAKTRKKKPAKAEAIARPRATIEWGTRSVSIGIESTKKDGVGYGISLKREIGECESENPACSNTVKDGISTVHFVVSQKGLEALYRLAHEALFNPSRFLTKT